MDVTSIQRGRGRAIKKSIRAIKVPTCPCVCVCVCVYVCLLVWVYEGNLML